MNLESFESIPNPISKIGDSVGCKYASAESGDVLNLRVWIGIEDAKYCTTNENRDRKLKK